MSFIKKKIIEKLNFSNVFEPDNEKSYNIAEIGINHEGCIITAKEMVDQAFKSGAEIIKIQTHVVEDEMSKSAKNVIPGNSNNSIYSIMERCALVFTHSINVGLPFQ